MSKQAEKQQAEETEAKAPRPVGRQSGSGSKSSVGQPIKGAVKEGTIPTQTGEVAIIKAKLDKEPKVRVIVPLRFGERPGAIETVTINGYRYEIKKGYYVDVPQSVADLIIQQASAEAEAGLDKRVDLMEDDADKEALS